MRLGILASMLLFTLGLQAQGWITNFGSPERDEIKALAEAGNGDILAAGYSANLPYLSRLSADGDSLWGIRLDNFILGESKDVAITPDGGIVTAGYGYTDFESSAEALLFKTDGAGNLLWQHSYKMDYPNLTDSLEYNAANRLEALSDGGFALAGITSGAGIGQNIFFVRTDPDGIVNQMLSYGNDTTQYNVAGIAELPSGDIAIMGSGYIPNPLIFPYTNFIYYLRLDAQGQVVTYLQYDNTAGIVDIRDAIQTQDGSFLLAGGTEQSVVYKLDADGALIWVKNQATPFRIWTGIAEAADGGLVLVQSTPGQANNFNILLRKIDAEAEVELWSREINYNQLSNNSYCIEALSSEGFAVGGQVYVPDGSSSPFDREALVVKTNALGEVYTGYLQGRVFFDENENCTDEGEQALAGWLVKATKGQQSFFGTSDADGRYAMQLDTGSFLVTYFPSGPYWQSCAAEYQATLPMPYDTATLDIAGQAETDCPLLEVDLSVPFLRRCFNSNYIVSYCNNGTTPAMDATVEVTLDPFLLYQSSSIPFTEQNGNTFTFDLGFVDVNECGQFSIEVKVDCDASLGQTHCSEAHIFPDTICIDPFWQGPVIDVNGACTADSVHFQIMNSGGDMLLEQKYIVTEDNIMLMMSGFQLGSGQSTSFSLPVNSPATYRMDAEQAQGFPYLLGSPVASLSLEGCDGLNPGFVTIFPDDDAQPFVDIDCQDNIGAYDPNDKQAFPLGYEAEHFIRPGTELEYKIRFQNTGSDTAFTVIIRDTLSEWIDISTLRPGAASHPYAWRIYGPGILEFRFDNILLPDSTTNEPASRGVVEFKVQHEPDAPLGTVIENSAAIFFDFNAPVITNTTWHTLGENFIVISQSRAIEEKANLKVYPNPFAESATFSWDGALLNQGRFLLYDSQGRMVRTETISGQYHTFNRRGLPAGLYFFRLENDRNLAATGKLIIQ